VSEFNYDQIDRFLVFVEQLDVACDLLADGGLAKVRAALVGVDNLASLLLNAHANAVFLSEEGSRWYRRRRHTKKERRKILGSFDGMATLVSTDTEGPSWRKADAILSEADAAIMRVAHTYRNGVYHEDRHNSALLAPLTALYAQATGRAFCRFHSHGWSYGIDSARAERLVALGYEPRPDQLTPSALMLDFGTAAAVLTDTLTGAFEVDFEMLRSWLAADIVERTAWSAGMLVRLLDDGLPAERLEWSFLWSQFWAEHGADEEWMALEDERDDLADALEMSGRDGIDEDDPRKVAYQAAAAAYIERAHELQHAFKPRVQWGDAPRLGKLGERLETAKDIASLLQRYRQIDQDVGSLEKATMEAVTGWDELIEDAIDRSRGD
jgi:hypothetical protein